MRCPNCPVIMQMNTPHWCKPNRTLLSDEDHARINEQVAQVIAGLPKALRKAGR